MSLESNTNAAQFKLDAVLNKKGQDWWAAAHFLAEQSGIGLTADTIFQILVMNRGKIPRSGVGSKSLPNALSRLKLRS